MPFVGSHGLGVDLTRAVNSSTGDMDVLELGSVVLGDDGNVYRFILAGEALEQYEPVNYTSAYSATAVDVNEAFFGVTLVALASGEYGWICEKGMCTAQVTGSMTSGTLLKPVADAEGVIAAAIDIDEGGATAHGIGDSTVCGQALSAESGGTATVKLF